MIRRQGLATMVLMGCAIFLFGQAADPQCPASEGAPHAIDAEGNDLGAYISPGGQGHSVAQIYDPTRNAQYSIDAITGEVTPHSSLVKYYSSGNCTGSEWYVLAYAPWVTFSVPGDENVYVAKTKEDATMYSYNDGRGCHSIAANSGNKWAPKSGFQTVTLPQTVSAPVHIEMR